MTLTNFMTATASTQRMDSSVGIRSTHLENVKIVPVMSPTARGQQALKEAIGLQGSARQLFETFTEPHTHTDDSVTVTQLPDIENGDLLTVDGVTYNVRWAEKQPATTSFSETLVIHLTEDRRT